MKHYEVRRKDKAVSDRAWMEEILKRGQVLHLGMAGEDGWPYVVPMNYGYRDGVLYFHGAAQGRKIEILAANPRVCFQVALDMELVRDPVPSNYTMKYRSVTGFGKMETLTDLKEKDQALRIVMEQFDGPYADMGPAIAKIWIARLVIEELTGKSSVWPHP